MTDHLRDLTDAGVSVWLDDLSRERLASGSLAAMIRDDHIRGVTTNPTIFAAAIARGDAYLGQLRQIAALPTAEAIQQLCAQDVREACDLFAELHRATGGEDGWVSIEVEPALAHDAAATLAQARQLRALVARDNVLIKIPATTESLRAVEDAIAEGISVNVTLIFSVARYDQVMEAYARGLARARDAGLDLSRIHSVASVFISRLDAEVDQRLRALGRPDLCGQAAIANARVAVGHFAAFFSREPFAGLAARGAHTQRPLWASTGTKDPAYPDTLYVSELVHPGTVNTMPEKTLRAFADHGRLGAPLAGRADDGRAALAALREAGVDLDDVFGVLESQGVQKFVDSWKRLAADVEEARRSLPS
jgi:transaldolase